MATEIDPHGRELAALAEVANLNGARVLEVGCGDGRLALRYGAACRVIVGVEISADLIMRAVAARPRSAGNRFKFLRASGVALPFAADSFDLALFSWSL
jgi:ubiquinone/menaquinone biosynthesis C-methylase UbiE